MIPTRSRLRSSSSFRMAATRPSIMSDGATKSAPATACESAASATCATVTSLRISSPSRMPQCPCDVYSHRQTSVTTIRSGTSRFVHRQLTHARHRAHLAAHAAPFADEQRKDEAVWRQLRLAHEAADRLGAAEPPRPPRQREASGGSLCCHISDFATKVTKTYSTTKVTEVTKVGHEGLRFLCVPNF